MTLTILDETATGKIIGEQIFQTSSDSLTLAEIIRLRIYAEVEKYNANGKELFYGLVQPNESEKTLNGYRLAKFRTIDPEKQYYTALDMFQKNGYFVLVNQQQETELEKMINLNAQTTVSFVKLTPLVGG